MNGGTVAQMTGNAMELNNNAGPVEAFEKIRSPSRMSMSSASSCHSDSSEDGDGMGTEEVERNEGDTQSVIKRLQPDADPSSGPPTEDIFPSLPDAVLEDLGLLGDGVSDRKTEEEVEQKFATLALAFTIDSATIRDRCDRQRRYRDQTENNLTVEIDRLVEKIQKIKPFCVDAETTELMTGLLDQVDIVVRAASHAAISAEKFGAVQHEEKLTESVSLMVQHVTLLKQQRDSAKRQLQYTKRVLQDTNTTPESSSTNKPRASSTTSINGPIKRIDRRRASIAAISQQPNLEHKRITRRTSDLSLRTSALLRASRPSRLELGVDLRKIKEGTIENGPNDEHLHNQSDFENDVCENKSSPNQSSEPVEIDTSHLPYRYKILRHVRQMRSNFENRYTAWSNNGTLHEIFCFGALMCFSFSIITMANILIEMEFAKHGINTTKCFWHWNTWLDVFATS